MKFSTAEELAVYAITHAITHDGQPPIQSSDVVSKLQKKGACFVTVYIEGNLRGCIGDITAFEPLHKNIVRNATNAVSSDFRFKHIEKEELSNLSVEVSVLTPLQLFHPKTTADLLQFLGEKKPGLVIEKEGRRAVFLPQVWEDLPKPEDFLTNLCLKADLHPASWQTGGMTFRIFFKRTDY